MEPKSDDYTFKLKAAGRRLHLLALGCNYITNPMISEGIVVIRFDPTVSKRDCLSRALRLLKEDLTRLEREKNLGKALLFRNRDGNAALHLAVKTNCCTSVKLLFDYGVQIFELNNAGDSPLDIAEEQVEIYSKPFGRDSQITRHEYTWRKTGSLSVLKLLREHSNKQFVEAVLNVDLDSVNFFIQKGIDLDGIELSGVGLCEIAEHLLQTLVSSNSEELVVEKMRAIVMALRTKHFVLLEQDAMDEGDAE